MVLAFYVGIRLLTPRHGGTGICTSCGYDRVGLPSVQSRCPECGHKPPWLTIHT